MKRVIAIILSMSMVLLMSVSAFAAEPTEEYSTPAEAIAGLTGRTVESVIDERSNSGKTYGAIAKDANLLEEFKAICLKMKKENLNAQVADGKLTQEEADTIIALIEANQALCDGSGSHGTGKANGAWLGSNGCGRGIGGGRGQGRGCRSSAAN